MSHFPLIKEELEAIGEQILGFHTGYTLSLQIATLFTWLMCSRCYIVLLGVIWLLLHCFTKVGDVKAGMF